MATNVGYMNMYIEAIAILLKYKTDWLLLCCSEIKLQVPLMTFKAFPGLTVSSHINLTYSLLLYASHSSPAAPAYWSCSCLRTTVLPNSPVHSPLPLNICMAYSPRLFASTIIKPKSAMSSIIPQHFLLLLIVLIFFILLVFYSF